MQYAVSIVLSVVSAVLAYVVQNLLKENQKLRADKKQEQELKQDAISNGVLSLLRIQLIEYHDKYMIGDKIPSYVYDNWNDMYNAYKQLGGNGLITRMKEDIDQLKVDNK